MALKLLFGALIACINLVPGIVRADVFSKGSFWSNGAVSDRITTCGWTENGSLPLAKLSSLNVKWEWQFITNKDNQNFYNTSNGNLNIGVDDNPAFTGYFEIILTKKDPNGTWGENENAYRAACDKMVRENQLSLNWVARLSSSFSSKDWAFSNGNLYYKKTGAYGFRFDVQSIPSDWKDSYGYDVQLQTFLTGTYINDRVPLNSRAWSRIGTTARVGKPSTGLDISKEYYNNTHAAESTEEERSAAPVNSTPTAVTNAEADNTAPGLGETLLGFIAKIIGYIVYFINSVIYFLFSFFLVPIISALLSVQPWKDNFVNIIYPGWLIIRNLANVAFIISLLVVGLRVLFQVEDAAKSRSFIKTLVIMALLVNFSLVIAQGAVAIADTVQSQFLPKDSKVIEALGWKLMAEPAQNFNNRPNTESVGIGSVLAELYFPIVLLMLAVASFFSFIAIAGFIFVRLVMLWILYMVSPVAYFGAVLSSALGGSVPQASDISKKWWTEFIKYALTVPILAFFLNMAALVATIFTQRDGTKILVGGTSTWFGGANQGVADEMVRGALTVATHFIVLLFIWMGMRYAQMSGTVGADKIVNFAKKGYDQTLDAMKKGAKNLGIGAKNYVGDKAALGLEDRGKGKLAALTSGLFRPKEAMQELKEKAAKEYADRIGKPAENRAKAVRKIRRREIGLDSKASLAEQKKLAEEKDVQNMTTTDVSDEFTKAQKNGDDIGSAVYMKELMNRGEFEGAIKSAKDHALSKAKSPEEIAKIEQDFAEDGLSAAIQATSDATKMSDADRNNLYKHARDQAKKHEKEDYLDVGLGTEEKQRNQDKRAQERLNKGPINLVENTNISNSIEIENNTPTGFKESTVQTYSKMDFSSLKDAGAMSEFRKQPGFNANKQAYLAGGRDQIIEAMGGEANLTSQQKDQIATLDEVFFKTGTDKGGSGSSSSSSGAGGTSGGSQPLVRMTNYGPEATESTRAQQAANLGIPTIPDDSSSDNDPGNPSKNPLPPNIPFAS